MTETPIVFVSSWRLCKARSAKLSVVTVFIEIHIFVPALVILAEGQGYMASLCFLVKFYLIRLNSPLMYMSTLLYFYVRGLHLENISVLVVVVLHGHEHSHTALCDFSKYLREVIDASAPAKCARNIQEEFFNFQFWHVDLHDLEMRIVLSTSALMIICVETSVVHACPFSPAPHNRG